MKKIILTEIELVSIIKKIIVEQQTYDLPVCNNGAIGAIWYDGSTNLTYLSEEGAGMPYCVVKCGKINTSPVKYTAEADLSRVPKKNQSPQPYLNSNEGMKKPKTPPSAQYMSNN